MAFSEEQNESIRKELIREARHCGVTIGMRKTSVEQLAEAVGQAPADTRAWLRAEIVRRFPEQVVAASWSHLTVRGESSGDENVENSMVSLDMSNPLKFTESLCSEAFERVHTASGIVESLR